MSGVKTPLDFVSSAELFAWNVILSLLNRKDQHPGNRLYAQPLTVYV